jgi:NitT/TauT family transport system substrate-binding protein
MNGRTASRLAVLLVVTCLAISCRESTRSGPANPGAETSGKGQANVAGGAKTFRVATLTWVGYAPIYLAKEKGFFEGIDVEPVLIEDTSSRRAALTSGDVVASTDIVDSFTNALAAGVPAKVVLKLDDSMGGDGIVVKKQIGSIKDLRGRTVAYPDGQPSHFFLLKLLEDAGLTSKDIKASPMESADQAGAAFVSGSVDAAVTWEPFLSKAGALPNGKILTTSREQPGLIVDIFTVRNDYLEQNPDVVKAFIKGWFKAIEYWKQNPADADRIMAKAMKLDRGEFEKMIKGIRYSDLAENHGFFGPSAGGSSKFIQLATLANKLWTREGVIKNPVDPIKADGSRIVLSMRQ